MGRKVQGKDTGLRREIDNSQMGMFVCRTEDKEECRAACTHLGMSCLFTLFPSLLPSTTASVDE